MKHFIQTMAPGWFASVMGTSVASLAAWLLFAGTPWQIVADVLHYLAIVMMVVLGLAGLARILMFPRRVFETMSHPVEGSFYATFPIAMLVMAVVGLVTIYVKQRGGLHNKRRAKGIHVYKNLRRNS